MKWDKEAKELLGRVPLFVRWKVKRRVEEEARRVGAKVVRLEHVISSQRRFLERMEEEVKGWRVETCFGPTGCPNRAVKEEIAGRLEELLKGKELKEFLKGKVEDSLKIHHEFSVSVSDCPNACSRPQIADIGLIGAREPQISAEGCTLCEACVHVCEERAISLRDNGPVIDRNRCLCCGKCIEACPTGTLREGRRGYRIMVGGKLGRHPRLGEEIGGIYSPEEVIRIVDGCVDYYKMHCEGGERLREIMERRGLGELIMAVKGRWGGLDIKGFALNNPRENF